jgi:hypothetical protein
LAVEKESVVEEPFLFIVVVRSKMLYKYGASQVQNLVTVRRKSSKHLGPKMRHYFQIINQS